MHDVLVAFGGNVGDVESAFTAVLAGLEKRFEGRFVRASSLRTYPAEGCAPGTPDFRNAVIRLKVSEGVTPEALLEYLLELQNTVGHGKKRWGNRRLDLDLLLFGMLERHQWPVLILPHPMLPWRRFVLEPAMEIAADMVHPPTGRTLAELLERLAGTPELEINDTGKDMPERRNGAKRRGIPYLDCRDVWRTDGEIPFEKIIALAQSAYGRKES